MAKHQSRAVRELTLRGVPIWLLREYLEQLGGAEIEAPAPGPTDPDGVVRADGAMSGEGPDGGWMALWRTETRRFHPRLPTEIAEHAFVFVAESESALESLIDRFMLKAQRGGG